MGLFDRLKAGLSRTRGELSKGLELAFGNFRHLDTAAAAALETALLAADIDPELSSRLIKNIVSKDFPQAREALIQALLGELGAAGAKKGQLLHAAPQGPPEIILIVGVNGAGKTTTCGKLSWHWKIQQEKILLAGADTFRAAAVEQLKLWAERAGVDFFSQGQDADPSAVAFDAVAKAKAGNYSRVIIDTAGRLQTKSSLMEELRKIHRVTAKAMPGAPHRVLLVLDGTSGKNMVSQAKLFNEAVPLTGLIITKLDGTAKAGAVFSVLTGLPIPVEMVGVGEAVEDLQDFDPETFVRAILE
jgi:fused signal recognition particle receptor